MTMGVAVELMPDWRQWEGEVVDGQYPLERFIGSGNRSAVFLTRIASGPAAIKLVLARPADAGRLKEQWSQAAILDHPNLVKIYDSGAWKKAKTRLAYVVTEYADENLATVLNERALNPDEVREMLPSIADALVFLHGRGYALNGLKPSNILATQDTLKVSTDNVSRGDASADMRACAATLTQALSRKPADPAVVESLPEPFREIARNCLGQNGRGPWSAAELASWLRSPKPTQPSVSKSKVTTYAIAIALVLIAVVTIGTVLRNRPTAPQPIASQPIVPQPAASQPTPKPAEPVAAPAAAPVEKPAPAREPQPHRETVAQNGQVVHEVLPDIPAKARRTIRGKATVTVKVSVNEAGEVTDATLQPGGSRYFGKLATEAARKWRFAPASGTRAYFLRSEITRSETKTTLEEPAK